MVFLFNELSLTKNRVDSTNEVKRILEEFVKTCIIAKSYGYSELRIHESVGNLYNFNLHQNYKIDSWIKDSQVDNDLKDKFREIITSSPLIEQHEIEEFSIYDWSEFSTIFNNKKEIVFGLGACHIFNSICLSLDIKEWDRTSIPIIHETISNDGLEQKNNIEINHFSNQKNIEYHRDRIKSEIVKSIERSTEIWDKRSEFFPNLAFGTEIEHQLKK